MSFSRWACAIACALLFSPAASAQTVSSSIQAPAGYAPMQSPCVKQANGACVPVAADAVLPTGGKQEAFTLVSANTPAAAVTTYGGSYVLTQSCTAYGTLSLRYRGPDNSTMTAMLSKTATDTGGGTLIALGTGAVVDATVSGTSGCNAILTRIP